MIDQPASIQLFTPVSTPPSEVQSLTKGQPDSSPIDHSVLLPYKTMSGSFHYDPNASVPYQRPDPPFRSDASAVASSSMKLERLDPSSIGVKLERADSVSSWTSSSAAYPPTPDSSIIPRTSSSTPGIGNFNNFERSASYDNLSYITVETVLPDIKNSEGKFCCTHCDRVYTHGKHLRRHMLRHTGERPYGCDWCPRRFTRADIRKRHVLKCRARLEQAGSATTYSRNAEAQYLPSAVQMYREDGVERLSRSRSMNQLSSFGYSSPAPQQQYQMTPLSDTPASNYSGSRQVFHVVPVTQAATSSVPPPSPVQPPHIAHPVPVHDARWKSHQQVLQFPSHRTASPQVGYQVVDSPSETQSGEVSSLPLTGSSSSSFSAFSHLSGYRQPSHSLTPVASTIMYYPGQMSSVPQPTQKLSTPSPPLYQSTNTYGGVQERYTQVAEPMAAPTLPPPLTSNLTSLYTPPIVQPSPLLDSYGSVPSHAPSFVHTPRPGQFGLGIYVNEPEPYRHRRLD
ncbi:hypothetical protein AWJ20_4513 [Sugiyamaella lignohabitans]|uniref:C2H2-type domain-containing protein n=1 Tax=Sugiyamaella lignohabitans TaxID=796027 RepID=A0A167CH74_9ASCO|nr:uncharacterized protein AWJ20_4513 [Sugiyamaella lignohabitans]ANB11692.1 hypothetical protein AWJ20_4513 [Sugiyamaella lignohabitans]